MTINPITQSHTNIETTAVELNATNPEALAQFYIDSIGLFQLEVNDDKTYYVLGTQAGLPLVYLHKATQARVNNTTGLYHLAFLLPERSDLGEIIRHMVINKVPLTGASDHGYSEALYLDDPEGNGIEIYVDKDKSEWSHHEDGQISGIVEPMDVEAVVAEAKKEFAGIPDGTIMGHLHLHISDLEEGLRFYHEQLGLGLKFIMGQRAMFLATQGYHHHLGANLWAGTQIPAAAEGAEGLRASIWIASQEDLDTIEGNFKKINHPYEKDGSNLIFKDPAGTTHKINLKVA